MFDPKDLQSILGSVQDQLKSFEDKAKSKIINAKSGGGLIDIKMNALGELIDIHIDDELLSDKQSLQILLMSAINEGYKEVDANKKQGMLEGVKDMGIFGDIFSKNK